MIHALGALAKNVGCYKSILGCSEENEPFYVKCGFNKGGRMMKQYYDEAPSEYERGWGIWNGKSSIREKG